MYKVIVLRKYLHLSKIKKSFDKVEPTFKDFLANRVLPTYVIKKKVLRNSDLADVGKSKISLTCPIKKKDRK